MRWCIILLQKQRNMQLIARAVDFHKKRNSNGKLQFSKIFDTRRQYLQIYKRKDIQVRKGICL